VLNDLMHQTRKPDEIIVVDDGSTDGTKNALLKFQNRITYIYQDNHGASSARNRGARDAHGEFLLFCDADLKLSPDILKTMHDTLVENPSSAFVYSSFKYGWKEFPLFPFSASKLETMPYIHSTSMLRKEWFTPFDETLTKFQDWDFFLSIAKKGGEGKWINEYLFTVLPHKGGMSQWFPKFLLKVPGSHILKRVRRYKDAYKVIRDKYNV